MLRDMIHDVQAIATEMLERRSPTRLVSGNIFNMPGRRAVCQGHCHGVHPFNSDGLQSVELFTIKSGE